MLNDKRYIFRVIVKWILSYNKVKGWLNYEISLKSVSKLSNIADRRSVPRNKSGQ